MLSNRRRSAEGESAFPMLSVFRFCSRFYGFPGKTFYGIAELFHGKLDISSVPSSLLVCLASGYYRVLSPDR